MRKILCLLGTLLFVVACNSSSDGNSNGATVQGLKLPTAINVATPQSANTTRANTTSSALLTALSATDPGTDFSTDPVNIISGNSAVLNLDIVNVMLCILNKLHVTDMVNQGAYTTKLNSSLCSSNTDRNSQSSPSYITVTVLSERADNQSPQIVKTWVDDDDPNYISSQSGAITPKYLLEITIRDSVSDTKPFGDFDIIQSLIVDASRYGGNVGEEMVVSIFDFRSNLTAQNKPRIDVAFVSGKSVNANVTDQDLALYSATELNDASGDTGQSKYYFYYDYNGTVIESSLGADFNTVDLMTTTATTNSATTQQCLSRTDAYSEVYQYNLYHSADGEFRGKTVTAGERLALNTILIFTYNGIHGSISNWGYWLENNSLLPDQASLFDNQTNATYTAHVSPGVLKRYDYSGTTSIYENVEPTDVTLFGQPSQPITLYCYTNCPKGGMTQNTLNTPGANIQDVFYSSVLSTDTPYSYILSSDGLKVLLQDDSNGNLVDFSQLNFSAFNATYITSGSMYTQTLTDNPNQKVYYDWYTGPDQYAQLVTVTDSQDQLITFDADLQVPYTFKAGSDRYDSTYPATDTPITLYYSGNGWLSGLPSYQNAQGVTVQASLKDGVELQNSEGDFLVKATDIMQVSIAKDISECTTAALDSDAVLNGTALPLLTQSDLINTSFTAADQPIVNDPPKVIDGVIQ